MRQLLYANSVKCKLLCIMDCCSACLVPACSPPVAPVPNAQIAEDSASPRVVYYLANVHAWPVAGLYHGKTRGQLRPTA